MNMVDIRNQAIDAIINKICEARYVDDAKPGHLYMLAESLKQHCEALMVAEKEALEDVDASVKAARDGGCCGDCEGC